MSSIGGIPAAIFLQDAGGVDDHIDVCEQRGPGSCLCRRSQVEVDIPKSRPGWQRSAPDRKHGMAFADEAGTNGSTDQPGCPDDKNTHMKPFFTF
jgi:hypothetical protein